MHTTRFTIFVNMFTSFSVNRFTYFFIIFRHDFCRLIAKFFLEHSLKKSVRRVMGTLVTGQNDRACHFLGNFCLSSYIRLIWRPREGALYCFCSPLPFSFFCPIFPYRRHLIYPCCVLMFSTLRQATMFFLCGMFIYFTVYLSMGPWPDLVFFFFFLLCQMFYLVVSSVSTYLLLICVILLFFAFVLIISLKTVLIIT